MFCDKSWPMKARASWLVCLKSGVFESLCTAVLLWLHCASCRVVLAQCCSGVGLSAPTLPNRIAMVFDADGVCQC
jgi:hypothetical protein